MLSLFALLALLVAGCVTPLVPSGMPAESQEMPLPAPQAGLITAENVRARPAPLEGGNGAAYMLLLNGTDASVTLQSAASDVSGVVELHETMADDGGVMRMIPRPEGFEIPAGGVVELKPGGKHVMFIGLVAPLAIGYEFPLSLTFSDGTTLSLTVPVVEMAMPAGMQGMQGKGDDHDMSDDHAVSGDHAMGDNKGMAGASDDHEIEFYGRIVSMRGGPLQDTWVVGDRTFTTNANTHFDTEHGDFAVGTCVEVEALADAPTVATEIESEPDHKCDANYVGDHD